MKYTEEQKAECVKLAQSGMALKTIQSKVGPNPKATMRYLAKQGIDYKVLRAKLKEDGKLQSNVKKQK